MKKRFISSFVEAKFLIARCLTLLILALLSTNLAWGEDTYERLTSIANIDESAQYVLGIDGTGFHYSGTSSWGLTALPSAQTPYYYTLKKAADGQSFTAQTTISNKTYYLQVPTSKNDFSMAESTGTNTDLIIGTTQSNAGDDKGYAVANKGTTTRHLRRNGDSGLRSYASNTGSLAFFYKVVKDEKTLVSIAISGNPDKTTYETGESFDPAGLVVTGTYTEGDPEEITSGIDWTITPNPLTAGTTSVSVTATVDGKSDTKNYNVTVTEHVITPGTFDIVPSFTFFGLEAAHTSGSHDDVTGKQNDITVVYSKGTQSYFYTNATQCRLYNGSTLTFSVPQGYEMTAIAFTADGNNWGGTHTASVGTMTDSKNWSGSANSVTITFGGTCRCTKITVTYAAAKVLSSIAVKNNPTKTTYYVGDEFDPAGLVITASYASGDPEDIAYSDANKDAFSFSGFNSAAEATDQVITVTYAEKSATFTVNIEEARVLNSIAVASNPAKMVYEVGEALDLTGLVVNGIFSKGDPEPVEYTANPADGTTLDAIGTTTVTLTSVDNIELTTSFDVTVNAIEGDRLTLASTGVSGSSYAGWSGKTGSEGVAVYAGECAGGNSSIQMRNQLPSGIVSTTSGGIIKKVKVDWNSNTSSTGNRSIDIYGSNTAYTGSGDIYNTEKQGTKLGSIVCGTSTELEVEGDYEYVGIRAIGGALYMNSITFVWSAPKVLESIAVKTAPTVVNYAAGEFFNPAGLVITATYDDESTKDITYEGNEDKFSFSPALDAALATTDEKVTITYGGKSCDQTITVKNIELTEITLSGGYPTEFWKGETFSHEGMTVTAHYDDESTKDVTSSATFSGYDMATLGEQEVTVTYEGMEAKYNITVKTIANTKETAYTVAQAIELIDAGNDLGTEVYVKGIVSEIVTPWDDKYNNITYSISEDGETTSQQFQLYRCETNGAVAGDYVIAKGTMKKFGETYELSAGNTIEDFAQVTMSITSAKLSTFIAPFPVTIPEGVHAYTAVASADAIEYTEVENVIPACTPVVLYKDVTTTYKKTCKGSRLATENSYKEGSLVGTLVALESVPTNVGGAPTYLLQNNSGVVGFYKTNPSNTYTLNANRAYLVGVNSVNAKDFFGFDDNNPTGISEINVSKFPVEGIYDLSGRKLAVPQKGINIINGVKVIVK